MCRKSAGITENIQEIGRYYRKYTGNLQVLQKMCRKFAGIAELGQSGQQISIILKQQFSVLK